MVGPVRMGRSGMISAGLLAALLCLVRPAAMAQSTLGEPLRAAVDASVRDALARTGVPSASIAVVRNRALVYAQAYGTANLEAGRPATPSMRYAAGSISKEFTASALLLLQDAGRLSVDDRADKYLSGLGPAGGVSIRALLSHTGGVRDFWPQDYVFADMLRPATGAQIIAQWADKPLDFAPGHAWQYSNTGYVIAGLIAERVAGKPLFEFLRERIFGPLGMASAYDVDGSPLPAADARGYTRFALGPPRRAVKEAPGWLFGAGELALTPTDLARWDIAMIEAKLMSPASYRDLTTEVLLDDGVGTQYALGLRVELERGRRLLSHGGEISGFTAANRIYPDDGVAVVVMLNEDGTGISDGIAQDIAERVFRDASTGDSAAVGAARLMFKGLQAGTVDPQVLTANARAYFSKQALADFQASLGPLKEPTGFNLRRTGKRGGLVNHVFDVSFPGRELEVVARQTPDGRFEQYTVTAK